MLKDQLRKFRKNIDNHIDKGLAVATVAATAGYGGWVGGRVSTFNDVPYPEYTQSPGLIAAANALEEPVKNGEFDEGIKLPRTIEILQKFDRERHKIIGERLDECLQITEKNDADRLPKIAAGTAGGAVAGLGVLAGVSAAAAALEARRRKEEQASGRSV